VAAPVTTADDDTLGAISISINPRETSIERLRTTLRDEVHNAAQVIGMDTSYDEWVSEQH
jgi:DNA-binding IclR family transcriptional regulator